MSAASPIYLDHHATTPVDPRVVQAMQPFLAQDFGNASSRTHAFGWRASEAVEKARVGIAETLGADPRELVFTSGATEANNLALLGVMRAAGGGHVVSCRTEHSAVLDPCDALKREGCRVTLLDVDAQGRLDPDRVRAALEPDTRLVSVMLANNEIGVIHDLPAIAECVHAHGAWLHSDAAQAVGRIPVAMDELGADLLSVTAHKAYGPKGIGALIVRRRMPRLQLVPLVYGGGHERGLRSGTLPVALCVGMERAFALSVEGLNEENARLVALRDRLHQRLQDELDGVHLNGDAAHRVAGNLNLSFDGIDGGDLALVLEQVAVSTGSACSSARPEPSHVLRALGLGQNRALSSLRFGLGRGTTADEIERAADSVVEQVRRLRRR